MSTTILSVTDLSPLAGLPDVRLLDLRFSLDDPDWGEREYEAGHIPGAIYVHLGRDLSGPLTGMNGRHPLPSVDEMARRFGALGIGDGVEVVAYDQDNGVYASRLWWMLRHLGHDAVAVLDGGFARWVREGRPVRAGRETATPRTFTPRVRPGTGRTEPVKAPAARPLTQRLERVTPRRGPRAARGRGPGRRGGRIRRPTASPATRAAGRRAACCP